MKGFQPGWSEMPHGQLQGAEKLVFWVTFWLLIAIIAAIGTVAVIGLLSVAGVIG